MGKSQNNYSEGEKPDKKRKPAVWFHVHKILEIETNQ